MTYTTDFLGTSGIEQTNKGTKHEQRLWGEISWQGVMTQISSLTGNRIERLK